MPDGISTTKLDPVDYAVVSQGLIAAAREMGVKLIRSAYSNIVREASDASAALLDRDGNVVAQAELIPMKGALGSLVKLQQIFAGVTWFVVAEMITLALIVAFPLLSLWLPALMD